MRLLLPSRLTSCTVYGTKLHLNELAREALLHNFRDEQKLCSQL